MLASKLPQVLISASGYDQGDVTLNQPRSKGFADAGGGTDDENLVVVEHDGNAVMKRLESYCTT